MACSSSGLPVTFTLTNQADYCSLSSSGRTIKASRPVQECQVTAKQPGNDQYAAAPSVTRQFVVAPQQVTLSWSSQSTLTKGETSRFSVRIESAGKVTKPVSVDVHGENGGTCTPENQSVSHAGRTASFSITATEATGADSACRIEPVIQGDEFMPDSAEATPLTLTISS